MFMRILGVDSSDGKAYTRRLNQMRRLFNAHVRLIYKVVRVQVALASDEIRDVRRKEHVRTQQAALVVLVQIELSEP